jgi:hypothetical protein
LRVSIALVDLNLIGWLTRLGGATTEPAMTAKNKRRRCCFIILNRFEMNGSEELGKLMDGNILNTQANERDEVDEHKAQPTQKNQEA